MEKKKKLVRRIKPITKEENERLRKFREDLRAGRIKLKPFTSANFFDDEPEDFNYEVIDEDEETGAEDKSQYS